MQSIGSDLLDRQARQFLKAQLVEHVERLGVHVNAGREDFGDFVPRHGRHALREQERHGRALRAVGGREPDLQELRGLAQIPASPAVEPIAAGKIGRRAVSLFHAANSADRLGPAKVLGHQIVERPGLADPGDQRLELVQRLVVAREHVERGAGAARAHVRGRLDDRDVRRLLQPLIREVLDLRLDRQDRRRQERDLPADVVRLAHQAAGRGIFVETAAGPPVDRRVVRARPASRPNGRNRSPRRTGRRS